ncbi:MAG: hypothetical protein PHQ23_00370 [Candidatus Wallbacteria bacterium]|nr:hypothetical protein [Candidatus Wallbacteria bacterium]
MNRAFSLAETLISLAFFSLLLMLVLGTGRSMHFFYKSGVDQAEEQRQDEVITLTLKPVTDNLKGLKWFPEEKRLFLWSDFSTTEIFIDKDGLFLDSGTKRNRLTGNSVADFRVNIQDDLLRLELLSTNDINRSYYFHLLSYRPIQDNHH